jgi:hypothetical protein
VKFFAFTRATYLWAAAGIVMSACGPSSGTPSSTPSPVVAAIPTPLPSSTVPPSPSPQMISDEAQVHYDSGLDHRDAGEFGQALVELDQALALSPGFRAAERARSDISAQATRTVEQAQAEATRVAEEQATAIALAPRTPTPIRPDASVVLFDYQVVSEPLTKLEDSVDRVLAGLRTQSYLPGARQGRLAVDVDSEARVWGTTRLPDPPRGMVPFHAAQRAGNQAVTTLRTKPNLALVGFTEESVRQNIGSVDSARNAHQALFDVLSDARKQLTEARRLLEVAKSDLLQQ